MVLFCLGRSVRMHAKDLELSRTTDDASFRLIAQHITDKVMNDVELTAIRDGKPPATERR